MSGEKAEVKSEKDEPNDGYAFQKVKIRTDSQRMAIKYQSFEGRYSHGWSNLEGGFMTVEQMQERFNELLKQDKYVEG